MSRSKPGGARAIGFRCGGIRIYQLEAPRHGLKALIIAARLYLGERTNLESPIVAE